MKLRITVISAILVSGLICSVSLAATTLKLSHNQDRTHAVHKAMEFFANKTKEYTNGDVLIRIYPNATLGNERESLELMNSDALQMVKVNAASIESFAPAYSVYNLPFIFKDRDAYYNTLMGPVGEEILLSSKDKGFIGLTYYDGGARSFYANKAINTPDDLAGVKIRVQSSPSAVAMMEALGGIPTPMAQGELYTAIQQGVVDGGENNPVVFADMRHGEVAKVLTLDEHTMVPDILVISTKAFNALSPENQKAVKRAATESMLEMKDNIWPASEKEAFDKMKTMGVTIVNVDKTPFQEKSLPLYEAFRTEKPDFAKYLDAIIGK
ncbi:C4-dicarboxylate ABC transporter substrate-binding protein [Gammaproteobacteria bacterium]|nr:C4-dicarboxylate ABC transporter substrate-binding protein [Gammaproteobacteria bacterium]